MSPFYFSLCRLCRIHFHGGLVDPSCNLQTFFRSALVDRSEIVQTHRPQLPLLLFNLAKFVLVSGAGEFTEPIQYVV
jgi:hypothetical protein